MIARDPLGGPAELAAEVSRRLERAASAADAEWSDGARREFDRRHLQPIRTEARAVAKELSVLADTCRRATQMLGEGDQ